MAINFRVSVHRNSDSLHLRLTGDFDGASAQELLDAIKRTSTGASRVFIHTGSLNEIHPFGRDVFHSNMDRPRENAPPVVFTGDKAEQLAPEAPGSRWFRVCHG